MHSSNNEAPENSFYSTTNHQGNHLLIEEFYACSDLADTYPLLERKRKNGEN